MTMNAGGVTTDVVNLLPLRLATRHKEASIFSRDTFSPFFKDKVRTPIFEWGETSLYLGCGSAISVSHRTENLRCTVFRW